MSDQIAPTADLPPRLRDVLAEIPGTEHGPRFQLLFVAAATAIDVLGDLDFTSYEIDDLAQGEGLWEILAPAIEDTTNSVGAFLECVRTLFAVTITEPEEVDEELASWFKELESRANDVQAAPTRSPRNQLEEVTSLLQAICDGLSVELSRFRKGLDELRAHPDRWLLLDHVAMFRGKVRSGIGAMVYMGARLFLDVTREEVVPAYRDDVESAVSLRRELAGLSDEVRMYHAAARRKLDEAALRALLARVKNEVDDFVESPSFLLVRAADKRPFSDVRRNLQALIESDTIEPAKSRTFMEGLTRFLESMSAINRREILVIHDASAVRQVQELLGAARAAAEVRDGESALEPLRGAVARCQSLQGRDEHLDAACRVLRHVRLDALTPLEIISVVRLLERAL